MLKRRKIYRVLFNMLWLLAGAATCLLLVSAAQSREAERCKGVNIHISGVNGVAYVSKKQILKIITGNPAETLEGKYITDIDLSKAEEKLEQNLWIRNAELYFDNNHVLQVEVIEREPVARIFTQSGQSFYVDETAECLPLSTEQVARVPVFTSYPADMYSMRKADSVLLLQIRDLGRFILRHKFWMAQIEQIDVVEQGFEMIPKLGNHIIYFGDASALEHKFNRLQLFYYHILRHTGWNYYSKLDLSFDKLLVATRRDSMSFIKSFVLPSTDSIHISNTLDSLKLKIDAAYVQPTTGTPVQSGNPTAPVENASVKVAPTAGTLPSENRLTQTQSAKTTKSDAMKNQSPVPAKRTQERQASGTEGPQPKAVMPPRSNNSNRVNN